MDESIQKRVIGTGPIGRAAEYRIAALKSLAGMPRFPAEPAKDRAWYLTGDVTADVVAGDFPDSIRARFAELVFSMHGHPLLLRTDRGDVFGGVPATDAAAVDETAALRPLLNVIRECVEHSGGPGPMTVLAAPGRQQGTFFFPDLSALACSYNPYVWSEYIPLDKPVVRIVCGMSTHFNDRSGDDFSRIVSLGAPDRRPETGDEEKARYAQRRFDRINMTDGRIESAYVYDLLAEGGHFPAQLVSSVEKSADGSTNRILTFDPLLKTTPFLENLGEWMERLKTELGSDIRLEFSTRATPDGSAPVEVIGCRPMRSVSVEQEPDARHLLEACGSVMGFSREMEIDRLVYVSPARYGQLTETRRYDVARLIGRINRALGDARTMLVGPGRWATSSAALGIPVSFAEISRAAAIVEVVAMHDTLTPEVSRGAHIFNELVARNTIYVALFPGAPGNRLATETIENAPNQLLELAPDAAAWQDVVRVLNAADLTGGTGPLRLRVDARSQRATVGAE